MPYVPYYRRKPEKPNKPEHDRFEKITLGTAIVGVTVLAVTAGIMTWQGILIHGQLDEMRAEQRAWVSLEASIASDFSFKPYPHLNLSFDAINTGHSPAVDVFVVTDMMTLGDFRQPPGRELKSRCEKLREEKGQFGYALFPSEHFRPTQEVRMKKEDFWAWGRRRGTTDSTGFYTIPTFIPTIAVCVLYKTASGETHETDKIYYVGSRENGGVRLGFDPNIASGLYPAGAIELVPEWDGGTYVN